MIVLKILLIILGIILGLLLFLVLSVLFCPLRYQAAGESEEEILVNAKITWFLSALGFYFQYGPNGKMQMWLRILFWKKMLLEEDAEESLEDNVSPENELEIKLESDNASQDLTESHENTKQENIERELAEEIASEKIASEESSSEQEEQEITSEEETSSQEEIFSEEESWEEEDSKKNRKTNLGKNIKDIIERIKVFDYDDRDKAALSHLKTELVKVLKHICPKKARLNLIYSTGAPDTTGISLGIIAMFPIAYKNCFNIVPDFQSEEAYAKGDGWMKGRIYVFFLLGVVIRVLRDKNCVRLYHKIKNF